MNRNIYQKYLPVLLAMLWGFLHLPFLSSDAWQWLTFSRGPFTDEGLYTLQIRNAFQTGSIDLWECDNFLKAPLFQLCLFIPFYFIGDSIETARGSIILLNTVLIWLLFSKFNKIQSHFFLFGLFFFPSIFFYGGYAMPEISSILMIALATLLFSSKSTSGLRWGTLLIALAICFKIQFLYVFPLILVAGFLRWKDEKEKPKLIVVNTLLGLTPIVILFSWLFFNREVFKFMMENQSGNFIWEAIDVHYLWFNFKTHLLRSPNGIFFSIIIILFIPFSRNQPFKSRPIIYLVFSLVWVVLEFHKVFMDYLPTRYILAILVAFGLGFTWFLEWSKKAYFLAVVSAISLILLGSYFYVKAIQERSFVQSNLVFEINNLSNQNEVIAGPFAGSLNWGSQTIAKPIWKGFLPKDNTWQSLSPNILITEPTEFGKEKLFQSKLYLMDMGFEEIKKDTLGNWPISVWKKKKNQDIKKPLP